MAAWRVLHVFSSFANITAVDWAWSMIDWGISSPLGSLEYSEKKAVGIPARRRPIALLFMSNA